MLGREDSGQSVEYNRIPGSTIYMLAHIKISLGNRFQNAGCRKSEEGRNFAVFEGI